MSYQVSDKGLAIIENFEGFVSHPYLDSVRVPTIGYGTTFYPNGRKVSMQDPSITKEQAVGYLQNYINALITPALNKFVKVSLNQNQVDALASFIYNEGSGGFAGSHLLQQINAGASCSVIKSEFQKWIYAGHRVLDDLVKRRNEEAELYCT